MTVAYRSTATATNPTGTDATSVTVSKPTGTVDGDLMVAVTHGYIDVSQFAAPSGWTFVGSGTDSTGLHSRLYYRIASSEGASYVWTFQTDPGGGAVGVSISSFQGAAGIDSWDVQVTSTTDPSVGTDLYPARDSMRYDVYTWRDTTADTVTWTTGTETHDVEATDSGTIIRGQSGAYSNTLTSAGQIQAANTANPTNSVQYGIQWSVAIADTTPTAETWASTGFGVEMDLNGAWTDVTSSVLYDKGLSVAYGSTSEGGDVIPSSLNLTMLNTAGLFSPLVPASTYYDSLALNVHARTWVAYGDVGMFTEGQRGDRFRCPETTDIRISGDLDVRVDCEPRVWRQEQVLAANAYNFSSSLGNWVFYVDSSGYLHFAWGTALLTADVSSTVQVPEAFRQTVRATIDVDNGASGNTVTFYTSDSTTGTWTQLGDAVVTSGTTTIGNNLFSVPLTVGSMEAGEIAGRTYFPAYSTFSGRIYEMMLKSGIDGTTVANPVFSDQTTGTYGFTDAQGNVWSAVGNVVCTNRRYRFHGELSSAQPTSDTSNRFKTVNLTFSGPLRRVQQNTPPANSAMYRYYTSRAGTYTSGAAGAGLEGPFFPVAYWPLEDPSGASQVAAALPGGHTGKINGSPTFAAYSGFNASNPIVNLTTNSSIWLGVKAAGEATGAFAVEFLLSAPSGMTAGASIADIRTNGTDRLFRLTYPSTNHLQLTTYDSDYVQIDTTGSVAVTVAGALLRVSVVVANGTGYLWTQATTAVESGPTLLSSAISTSTVGRCTSVTLNPEGTMNNVYVGHVAVYDGTETPNGVSYGSATALGPAYPSQNPLNAFTGENAQDRAERVTLEEGLPFQAVGSHAANTSVTTFTTGENGEALGYQLPQDFVTSVKQCHDSDQGILLEPREFFGLGYRTRESLYNQPSVLTLDFSNAELSGQLLPNFDDLRIKNKSTVTRVGGGTYTYTQTDGARGADTVGTYPDSTSVSLAADAQLQDVAGWKVRLGTVNEYRFTSLTVAQENLRVSASDTLLTGLLRLDVGDRVVVQNPPDWLPPDDVTQVIIGYTEFQDRFLRDLVLYTVPESVYHVGVLGSSTRIPRANATGSTLAADVTSTDTTVSVASAAGSAVWLDSTTYAQDFPFDVNVGGEKLTVIDTASTLNLNPLLLTDATHWSAQNSTVTYDTGVVNTARGAAASLKVVPNGTSVSGGVLDARTAAGTVTPGNSYVACGWVYAPLGWTDLRPVIDWYDSSGTFLSTGLGSATSVSAGTWTFITQTLVAPASADSAIVRGRHGSTPASTDIFYWWNLRFFDTATSATTSPQTFTVTRSVNGVVKSHSTGDTVSLYEPTYAAW